MKIIQLAKKRRSEIERVLKGALKRKSPKEPYQTTWLGDIVDHLEFYNLVIKKKFDDAELHLQNLDTGSREGIDEDCWDLLDDILDPNEDED